MWVLNSKNILLDGLQLLLKPVKHVCLHFHGDVLRIFYFVPTLEMVVEECSSSPGRVHIIKTGIEIYTILCEC